MSTKMIIIYNILGFLGSGGILLSTMAAKKENIMKVQTGGTVMLLAADILAKGYSGAVQDLVAIIRNLTVIKGIHKMWLNAVFIVSGLALGIAFNNQSFYGFFPIFANFQFSCLVLWKKADEIIIKLSVLVSNICWAIFNFHLKNYANMAINIAICVSSAIFVIRALIKRNKAETRKASE